MKTTKIITSSIASLIVIIAGLAFGGCATSTQNNTESRLSTAGFRAVTPRTPQQQASFASMRPFTVERHQYNGQLVYAYADTNAGILYIGDASDYQRLLEQSSEEEEFAAVSVLHDPMAQDPMEHWHLYWGPWTDQVW